MGLCPIVVSSPSFGFFLGTSKGQEPALDHWLLSESSIERLNGSTVHGLYGTAKFQRHPIQISPLIETLEVEVRHIVLSE